MDSFISRKRLKPNSSRSSLNSTNTSISVSEYRGNIPKEEEEAESTDLKLATLASLYPDHSHEVLLESLIAANGSIDAVCQALQSSAKGITPKRPAMVGIQTSLAPFRIPADGEQGGVRKNPKNLTRKGQTLHLYSAEDIAEHTPCTIVHNFLPQEEADELLRELLYEARTFERQIFKLFDNVVESPHTACFYVDSLEEEKRQKTEYLYNGSFLTDVRQITPQMRAVAVKVRKTVNQEINNQIRERYPEGKKLKYQWPHEWVPNAAFVNCYKGGKESVGYHSDSLTYLGPRPTIGSLSLGVGREFRVRKVVSRNDEETAKRNAAGDGSRADVEGQIAIHLPHNSLLVMHAETQEEWKHSIHPAQVIDPHPIAGNQRINITYRHYRESFHPRHTPRCKCNVATVLRCAQRKKESRGQYMWMCHAGNTPGKQGCSFFQWATFDDDGEPPWVQKNVSYQGADLSVASP